MIMIAQVVFVNTASPTESEFERKTGKTRMKREEEEEKKRLK